MRRMYDSVTVTSVPTGGDLYAAYIDGNYNNLADYKRRFPHTRIVTITVLGTAGADVADCETGDLTPAHAARWAANEIHAGRKPTIYMNASTWPAVRAEVRKLGITGRVNYWVAQYDGHAAIPAGAVAKQYLGDHPNGRGGTYDASVVAAHWPGVDPDPAPPKPPAPQPEGDDVRLYIIDGTLPVWITNGIHRRWVQTPAELAQYEHDFGIKPVVLPKGSTFLNDIAIVGPLPK